MCLEWLRVGGVNSFRLNSFLKTITNGCWGHYYFVSVSLLV